MTITEESSTPPPGDEPTDPDACLHDGYHQRGRCPEANAVHPDRIAYVASLRALADFYETATDLPVPSVSVDTYLYVRPDEFPAAARALGGIRMKDASDDFFGVTRSFGRATVHVYSDRAQVCERRVVGVEKVQVPDPGAPLVEVEREVVEWECPPSVLDPDTRARGKAGVADLRSVAADARAEARDETI